MNDYNSAFLFIYKYHKRVVHIWEKENKNKKKCEKQNCADEFRNFVASSKKEETYNHWHFGSIIRFAVAIFTFLVLAHCFH